MKLWIISKGFASCSEVCLKNPVDGQNGVGVACDTGASVVETGKRLEDNNFVIWDFENWYLQIPYVVAIRPMFNLLELDLCII